jgi:hypothetical protein
MTSGESVIRAYFQALESGSHEQAMKLFSKYAIVDSPIYGKMQASEFLSDLFKDTTKSKITILGIFENRAKPGNFAAHFSYQWILKNTQFASFEGVDVFQLSPDGRIDRVSIHYDTSKVRDVLRKSRV